MGIAAVRSAIFETLAAADLDVDQVIGHEPVELPPGISLTVATAHVGGDEWHIALRVYVPGNLPPGPAQERLDSVLDRALDALPEYGPDDWTVEWDRDIGAFVATCTLAIPRGFED